MNLRVNLTFMVLWVLGCLVTNGNHLGLPITVGGFLAVFLSAGLVGLIRSDTLEGALLDLCLSGLGAAAGFFLSALLQAYALFVPAMTVGCLAMVGRRSRATSAAIMGSQLLFALVAGVLTLPPQALGKDGLSLGLYLWMWLGYLVTSVVLIFGPALLLALSRRGRARRFQTGGN